MQVSPSFDRSPSRFAPHPLPTPSHSPAPLPHACPSRQCLVSKRPIHHAKMNSKQYFPLSESDRGKWLRIQIRDFLAVEQGLGVWWAGQNGLGRAVGVVERTGLVSETSFGPEQNNTLFTRTSRPGARFRKLLEICGHLSPKMPPFFEFTNPRCLFRILKPQVPPI